MDVEGLPDLRILSIMYDVEEGVLHIDYPQNVSDFEALGMLTIALDLQGARCSFDMETEDEEED